VLSGCRGARCAAQRQDAANRLSILNRPILDHQSIIIDAINQSSIPYSVIDPQSILRSSCIADLFDRVIDD
jgi:hypothetical protein